MTAKDLAFYGEGAKLAQPAWEVPLSVPIFETSIKSLEFLHRGKVRDLYAVGDDKLLIVQTDRLSAFDVVLPDPIPGKGNVLTGLSFFWFDKLRHIVLNHMTAINPESVVAEDERDQVRGRAMVVQKCKPLLIEAVVRDYIIGSGWKDYQETGVVCGIQLPPGLKQAEKLPEPIFTPAGKAPAGEHDPNITFEDMMQRLIPTLQEYNLGQAKTEVWAQRLAEQIRSISLQLYTEAAEYAAQCGIIIADTKFEFGLYQNKCGEIELVLIDEALTPDSSRFWPANLYEVGKSPPSFDKQFVRDYLEKETSWGKKAPAPHLPEHVLRQTSVKYREALYFLQNPPLAAA